MAWSRGSEEGSWWDSPLQKSNHEFQHKEEPMTRTEAFEKAWRLVAKEKDYSLVDEIYHPDYKALAI